MKKINYLNPFGRMCISMGMIPSTYKESLTYEEQLLWLLNYLEKTVIPAVNGNAEATEELQRYYVELKQYVDDYFTDLNVQQEINNKLDAMAESGDLEEIISIYLNSQSIICFDTVADLKDSTALQAGSFAKTLGYYSVNDGGASLYKITDDDLTADEQLIIALDSGLFAVLVVKDYVYPEQLGAVGNDTTDDTSVFQTLMTNQLNIKLNPNKTYLITSTLRCKDGLILDLNNSTIDCTNAHLLYNFLNNSTATLYNGNGNLIIKNGIIKGGCISLIHAENVTIDNVKFVESLNNHNIELCACKDVEIKNCVFDIPVNEVEYIESINIDPCVYSSFPWLPNGSTTYDGTPNQNLNIYNCIFYGGNSYGIRDGVGSHASSENPHKYINVYDNKFINMSEDGVRLLSCNYANVNNNTIISYSYGVTISGDNNSIHDNVITSLREETTYVIRVVDNTSNLSEYNNIVYSNSQLQKRHILLSADVTCTFLKVDNVILNSTKSFSSNIITLTTDSRYDLTDFNQLTIVVGSDISGTYFSYDINAWFNQQFAIGKKYYIPDLDVIIEITGTHELQIASETDIGIQNIIAHVN